MSTLHGAARLLRPTTAHGGTRYKRGRTNGARLYHAVVSLGMKASRAQRRRLRKRREKRSGRFHGRSPNDAKVNARWTQTRSGPKIPAADQLKGKDFMGPWTPLSKLIMNARLLQQLAEGLFQFVRITIFGRQFL